jgi:hypothetical protein
MKIKKPSGFVAAKRIVTVRNWNWRARTREAIDAIFESERGATLNLEGTETSFGTKVPSCTDSRAGRVK